MTIVSPLERSGTPPALLLIGHGSADPRHAASLLRLVEAVRDRVRTDRADAPSGRVPRVSIAFLDHCGPSATEAMADLLAAGTRRLVVQPLLLAEAYHVKNDVPGAVRTALRATGAPRVAVSVAGALGPDRLLLEAMEGRLRAVGVWPGDEDTGLVLGAAGTSDPDALAGIEHTARAWRRSGWRALEPGYASAATPTADRAVTCLLRAGVRRVAVASYFLAPGMLHDRLSAAAGQAGARTVAHPLCTVDDAAPELVRLVVDRYLAQVSAGHFAVDIPG